MVSSVWPKTKLRMEQLGFELNLANEQQLPTMPVSSTTTGSNSDASSSSISLPVNKLANLTLRTSRSGEVESGDFLRGHPLRYSNNSIDNINLNVSTPENRRSSVSTPRTLGSSTRGISPIISPSTMSTKINAEFEKNVFFVNPDEPPLTTTLPPEEVFEELDSLGDGSSGQVVKMRHKPTGKICAVKRMRRTPNDEENKRIYMDLQVVLECECDNIVRCCGYFRKESEVWICMELMTTCFDKLLKTRKRPLPENFVGAIAASAVKALYYLKEKHNIIHRDVKPSNILINDRGQIKLCDFGISGRLIDSIARTRSFGCTPYMAPERIDLAQPNYDVRADVWSLGISLFELATGKSPYADCPTTFDILTKVIYSDPPVLPDDMEFSLEFKNLIAACLTKDPKHRPKYRQLLEQDFIKKHMNTRVSLDELD